MNEQKVPAVAGRVERPVRPHAWQWMKTGPFRKKPPPTAVPGDWTPLYDQEALDAAREEGYAIGRGAEAEYWRSRVERLTAQADEWNRRYMALLKQVADGRALQPAPAIVVDTGPNCGLHRTATARAPQTKE